jgi:GT2 family glycosyltransferase
MGTSKRISIIIPTKDRPDELNRFLTSLDDQTLFPDELVVVDSSIDNLTFEVIQNKKANTAYKIKYISSSPGGSYQRNIGFRSSIGDLLFFFDDDVVLDSDYIATVVETYKALGKRPIGGVTGKIMNYAASPKGYDKLLKKIFFLSDYGNGRVKLSGFPSLRIDDVPSYIDIMSGCNMSLPREVFSKFLFDEILTGYSYMEDVDISCRIRKKYLLFYQPKAKLSHYPNTYKKYDSKILRKKMTQNHKYLFIKNQPKTLLHLFAFIVSIAGLIVYNTLLCRDLKASLGVLEGVFEPMPNAENN